MSEELEDFPAAFQDSEVMPWERGEDLTVPFPSSRFCGRPLRSLLSPELLRVRKEAVRRNGRLGSYFLPVIVAIDEILSERMGE